MQGVEGVEKFHLGRILAGDELDIVDEEHIRAAVFFPEGGVGVRSDRLDELVHELLALDVDDLHGRIPFDGAVGDGVHEVRFPES